MALLRVPSIEKAQREAVVGPHERPQPGAGASAVAVAGFLKNQMNHAIYADLLKRGLAGGPGYWSGTTTYGVRAQDGKYGYYFRDGRKGDVQFIEVGDIPAAYLEAKQVSSIVATYGPESSEAQTAREAFNAPPPEEISAGPGPGPDVVAGAVQLAQDHPAAAAGVGGLVLLVLALLVAIPLLAKRKGVFQ